MARRAALASRATSRDGSYTRLVDANDDARVFATLRSTEYSRLDRTSEAYLDFTGSALYPAGQITAHAERLRCGVFGNPHSENGASKRSTSIIEEARARVLSFLNASSDEYEVCFTANTTAAIKLVAESYPFGPRAPLVLAADNHNSMNGLREFARRRGSPVSYLPLNEELRLDDAEERLRNAVTARDPRGLPALRGEGLFGFPAQSNFSGVKHSLDLIREAKSLGYSVLVDAAAFLPANRFRLSAYPADFIVFSAYKILGYPTGVGALVGRKASMARLERPWFAGGTVDYASVQHGTHLMRAGAEAFEDGTPAFLSIAALCDGLDFMDTVGWRRLGRHISSLTEYMLARLTALTNPDGSPRVRIYGPAGTTSRGGAIAFNVLNPDGTAIPFASVVDRARECGVSLRGGCFCNPGAADAAFGFPYEATVRCLRTAAADGFTIDKFSQCLGSGIAVGAVRASFGIPSNKRDIDRAIEVIESLA
jgi:selenocysteine lyase/cysteine desulfurase